MVSGSVYIVFLDKCQRVTFFEVIYCPHKAGACNACLCGVVFNGEVVFYCYNPLHYPPYQSMHGQYKDIC